MKKISKLPLHVGWPITKERYRCVLAKMHRHWARIQELEALLKVTEEKLLESYQKAYEAKVRRGKTKRNSDDV